MSPIGAFLERRVRAPLRRHFEPLLVGSPLRRRGVAMGVVVVLAALLAVAAVTVMGLMTGGFGPRGGAVFLRSLLGASLFSAVPVAILGWLDRRERESPWLLAAAFLWGGVIATGLALPLNDAILAQVATWLAHHPSVRQELGDDATLLLGAPIAGPLVEELTKGLGVGLLFFLLRAEYDNVRDGFVYGAMVGAGFNWFEAPLYVAQEFARSGAAPWQLQLGARFALFGLAGHALYSGLFGAFLGLARQTRGGWIPYLAPVLGLALAIAAHALNNLLPLVLALAEGSAGQSPSARPAAPAQVGLWDAWFAASLLDSILFLPFLVGMLVWLWRSGRWERRVIREELAGETLEIVTPEEYRQIEADGPFQTRRVARLGRDCSAALVNAQHELAFRKRRVRDAAGDPDADPLVVHWREEIRRCRQGHP
ncbi:PrsW family intramembrane metalloprotease [Candidatus Methylocalor cossyra]|uniref:PrsW family intramembrane metalloprotease n=1 Tax=Candidatus Methylocalor cossyra TaxID=3108543 RepID=A0ABP1C7H4_9GAMM